MPRTVIVIAGGGTGGHVFPGLAVADALRTEAPELGVVFVGSARGLEARLVPAQGYRLELLSVEPMQGGGMKRAVRGGLVAARATWRARSLVRSLRPAAVLSVGGYAAGPMALAGALAGVPLALLEPNGVLGLTNRLLAPFARRAYVGLEPPGLPHGIVRRFGVPLRNGFTPRPVPTAGLSVLVMGGSQGARTLNERVPEALARVAERFPGLHVVHQSGPERDAAVRERYAGRGLTADVQPFLEDVPRALGAAHLVIARAGAATVAEVAAVGRPALFVPFPFAANDHQRTNAMALVHAGAASCVLERDANVEHLAGEIASLLGDASRRASMADAAAKVGRPDAARDVARDLLAFADPSTPSKVA